MRLKLRGANMGRKLTRQDLREAAEKYKNWGRWGAQDEIGTLNYTQAEDIVAAARLVRKGKVISLALNFDQNGPQGAKSKYPSLGRINPVHTMLRTGADAYSGVLDHRGIRAADDMVVMPLQCGTQWDGLGHIFYENSMWNGYDCREVTSFGAQKCGIEKTKSRMVGRGVFLDVPRALGMDVLPDGHAITSEELDRTAKKESVEVRRGDYVIVRTGQMEEKLAGYGVSHVFMVPAVLRRTFAEMERRTSIRRIHTHGEKAAAYMADGYARASGKPGVCMAQVVGALNLAAGLRDAWLAHSPVIAFTGGRDPKTKFRQVYQEIDDVPAFEPVTKWNATVDAVERFPDMLRQAFRVATSGAPGPVHLQFRGNEGQLDQEEATIAPLVEPQFARVPPYRPLPDPHQLKKLLEELQHAERPVIVAGGGARWSGAGPELVQLAEALAIPVATSLNGKELIPGAHRLSVGVVGSYSRDSANRVVAAADLVCFIGSSAGGMTTHAWAVPKIGTPALQIDIEPETIGRNYPLKTGLLADAKIALAQMLAQCDRGTAAKRKPWIDRVHGLCSEWR